MKPTFIIIGAARSGTTSLFNYLEEHPEVFMSQIKEINYFSNPIYNKKGDDWYLSHFENSKMKAIGEASTSYTVAHELPNIPQKIFDTLGSIKLIYILRDPIDRLISHYTHRVHRCLINDPLSDVIKSNDPMLKQGCYNFQIEQFLKCFPRENLHILTVSELKDDPSNTVNKLYEFLDLTPNLYQPDLTKKHNNSDTSTRKNMFGRCVFGLYRKFIEQRRIPYRIKGVVLKLAEIGAKKIEKPKLNEEQLNALVEYYKADLDQLSKNYGVDTSKWKHFSNN